MACIRRKMLAGVALALLVAVGTVDADSIGPCGSCDDAIYTLHYSGTALPDAAPLHETFRITLDIDTDAYSGGGSFLDNVAVKVSSSVTAATLFAAPGGVSDWTAPSLNTGLNANGCSGGGSGFLCIDGLANSGNGVAVTTGNGPGVDYAFVFDITVNNGALFTGVDQASMKARYVDSSNEKVGALLSEEITLQTTTVHTPEPSTWLLLATGVIGLLGCGWRRRQRVA